MSSEECLYFSRGETDLFGIFHPAAIDDHYADTCVVMSHPFGEEKLWSHRVFVNFARELAGRGYSVLRFDYMGAGDSSGDTSDASVSSYVADLHRAIEVGREKSGKRKVVVVGLRLGATIASLVAENSSSGVESLILWDPITDGDAYLGDLLRINLGTQLAVYGQVLCDRDALRAQLASGETVNVDGYEIGSSLYTSLSSIRLDAKNFGFSGLTAVLQISPTEKSKPREDLQRFADHYSLGKYLKIQQVPFWREIKPFCSTAAELSEMSIRLLENRHA